MKKILPSILSADFTNLAKDIKEVKEAGADLLHVDIMDGHFVPNITIGPSMVKQIHKITDLPLDVHLMVDEPEKFIDKFLDSGSSILTFHVEVKSDIKKNINNIKIRGAKAGLSLRPQTPIKALKPYLKDVDLVLVMSVNPGFGGQAFMPESLSRIRELKSLCFKERVSPIIEVDGGVNLQNIKELSDAGVDYFVAGNTIFGNNNRKGIISELRKKIYENN